jgi:urease accessory protein UreH
VLRGGAGWDGLGLAEGRPYFATIVLVADEGLDAFIAELPGVLSAPAAATVGVARLPRRGALARCLAADAPSLSATLDAVWRLARARLLGLRPLSLRKL